MINIDLQRGERVAPEQHKNQYELVVDYMHGDADGDTINTVFYTHDETDELKLDIVGLLHAQTCETIDDVSEMLSILYESQGVEDAHDLADSFRDKFWEGDITNEGTGACVTGYQLYYWDADGIKFTVDTMVNGKKI